MKRPKFLQFDRISGNAKKPLQRVLVNPKHIVLVSEQENYNISGKDCGICHLSLVSGDGGNMIVNFDTLVNKLNG